MTSIYFRIRLDTDGIILILSFEVSLSTFIKMADFHGIKDSSDIFLPNNNFPLIQFSKPSAIFSLLFFQFMIFGSQTGSLIIILRSFSFLITRKSPVVMFPRWLFKYLELVQLHEIIPAP